MTVNASIFWYDYETTGIDPRRDRPLQIAGIRTDEALNEIGEPMNLYCRPSDDILPHPMACLITGITPQRLAERGLSEADFMTRVHAQLAQPATCVAGYNSLRFDDEVTRYSLYRNFFDPYAREWQGGNSRWDLIDMVRTAYALRPGCVASTRCSTRCACCSRWCMSPDAFPRSAISSRWSCRWPGTRATAMP